MVLHSILTGGLDPRYCRAGQGAGAAYGEGVYFAEDSGKADQYASSLFEDLRFDDRLEMHKRLYSPT
jgi:hypothetical protein